MFKFLCQVVANRVTKTRRDHTATPPGGSLKTYYIREEYTYDAAGRLRFTRHHIKTTAGVPTSGWVATSAPLYDELNRLADKRLHASNYYGVGPITLDSNFNYLQSIDYSYNIRGWLTGMNDPASCTTQGGDQLADLFTLGLDYESTANGATAQYNGNIAAMQWRTNVNGSCLTRQQYRFTYDYANRLLTANHFTHNGTAWTNTNNYSESGISYDLNGNLKTYTRRGLTAPATYGVIDNLTYTYGDAIRADRLTNVSDAGSATKGFKFTSGAAAYTYDLNGNLTQDNHKGLSLGYNYLNLPNYYSNTGGADVTLTYTADGEKLTKVSPAGTRNYLSGIEYLGNALDAIYHAEGRCTPNGASAFYYEYTIKDHLGNARVNFRANGAAVTFLQELHYYPFGMLMEGLGAAKVTDNGYKYNGKELNEDLGLNLSDYGARWYDAALGRWWSFNSDKRQPTDPIYHLVTRCFNGGYMPYPPIPSIFFTKHPHQKSEGRYSSDYTFQNSSLHLKSVSPKFVKFAPLLALQGYFVAKQSNQNMAQVRIWVHAVWATKQRAPLMANKNKRIELFKHLKSYAREKKIYLDFINGESNHVHVLISLACDQNIAQIMKLLKGESSNFVNQKPLFETGFDWADDYYAASVSQSQVEVVRNYLKNQEVHHRRKTFEEECQMFMVKYGFVRVLG